MSEQPFVTRLIAMALVAVLTVPVSAQWLRYPTAGVPRTPDGKPNLASPAPRAPDGKPDLSGVWLVDGFGPPGSEGTGPVPRTVFFDVANALNGPPPYQPWAAQRAAERRDQNAKDNPDARCLPIGPLQMLAHPLPVDPQPTWYGYSTGRWEGDTLVVETAGFRDDLWADFFGSPLTDQARMTERYRRPNFGTLLVQVTIDDPKAYTRPWTIDVNQHFGLDTDLLEYACLENEKDVPRLVGK